METDYSKREPTLPPGCGDLIDMIKEAETKQSQFQLELRATAKTPREISRAFGRKPYRVLHDLMGINTLAGIDDPLNPTVLRQLGAMYDAEECKG